MVWNFSFSSLLMNIRCSLQILVFRKNYAQDIIFLRRILYGYICFPVVYTTAEKVKSRIKTVVSGSHK